MRHRLEILDALRGLASLAVCWFHMTNTYSEDSVVRISGHFGWLGVEVFFVITGFIIPLTMYKAKYTIVSDWGRYLSKRIIRLHPPYLSAAAMALILWYLSSLAPGFHGVAPEFSWLQLGLHLGYLNSIFDYPWLNPAFWTLAIEFQFYLLLSIVFPLISSNDIRIRIVSVFGLCALAFAFPDKNFVFHWLCLFTIGIVTFQYFCKLISTIEYVIVLPIVVLLLDFSMGTGPIVWIATLTALAICFINIQHNKLLTYFGMISYSLYLVHIPIGGRIVNLGKRWASSDFEFFIISIAGVLFSIAVAHLFYRFVEKPAQAWSSRINYSAREKSLRKQGRDQVENA